MIVDDKRFASMLDREVKTGYDLMVQDEEFHIMTGRWVLTGEMRELGRQTLAVLVKHLGYIPNGCCCRVFRLKDEYLTQGMVEETFTAEKNSYNTGEPITKGQYSGLEMGTPLYQLEDGRILSVQVEAGILTTEWKIGNAVGEAAMCWMDDDSCIWFRAYRPEKTDEHWPKWQALESVKWI